MKQAWNRGSLTPAEPSSSAESLFTKQQLEVPRVCTGRFVGQTEQSPSLIITASKFSLTALGESATRKCALSPHADACDKLHPYTRSLTQV